MAAIDYYNDEAQWGNYQYVNLDEVINTYIASRTPDDYTITIPRFQILLQARRGMRELYYDVVREIRAIELEISPSLMITLPPDYVNFVRISYVDANGKLHPMAVDKSMNIAQAYLQDDQFNLLFDNTGCVLIGDGVREPVNPDTEEVTTNDFTEYYFSDSAFTPNYNLSKNFDNGKYRIDKARGVIEFGSSVVGKNIVLEYISDGLFTGCEGRPEADIRVHKFAEEALMSYIYLELVKRNRNVPSYEKQRAEKDFNKNKRKAKRRINTINYDELMQIFKGQTKWIKGV
jgi:hypothetical protein